MTRMKKIEQVRERVVWENRYGQMLNDEIRGPRGDDGTYAYWRPAMRGIVVVPRRGDRVGLVRMHRYPINAVSIEVPRGMVDSGEELDEAAVRELREETGYTAERCSLYGRLWPDTGTIAHTIDLAVADVSECVGANHDEMESISAVEWKTRDEVRALIATGELRCSITIAALSILWAGA